CRLPGRGEGDVVWHPALPVEQVREQEEDGEEQDEADGGGGRAEDGAPLGGRGGAQVIAGGPERVLSHGTPRRDRGRSRAGVKTPGIDPRWPARRNLHSSKAARRPPTGNRWRRPSGGPA